MTDNRAVATSWRAYGLCREVDPELFFPKPSQSSATARRVCLACEVRVECREYAVEHGERGIWGGTTDNQRKALRRIRDSGRAAA